MSITTSHLSQAVAGGQLVAAESIFDTWNGLMSDLTTSIRITSVVGAIAVVAFIYIVSKGAMGRVVIAGLSAAIALYFVFNMTDVRDKGEETIGSPAVDVIAPSDSSGQVG